ncbi:MAG: hypothetical protein QM786_17520 [Breznakibacter sp.]
MNHKTFTMFLAMVCAVASAHAQTYEETRVVARTYKTAPSVLVDISNKYGMVEVVTWDNDSVKIEVTCRIAEKSEERFRKLKANIDFSFMALPNHVSAQTVLGDKHSTLVQNVKEVTNFLSASDTRSRIDYKVFVPLSANVKVSNKYGDVVLPSLTGSVAIDLSNGNLQARDIEGKASLNLAFGSAQFKKLRYAKVSLNFVDFSCPYLSDLEMDSKSSKIDLGQASNVQFTSRRDQIQIMDVSSIKGEAYFSRLALNLATGNCDLKLTYGELTELTLGANFKQCNIVSQTCDVNLSLAKNSNIGAMVKATRTKSAFPADWKPQTSNHLKVMETTPVRFISGKAQPNNQLNINISDAELKIDQQ